jgi:hypothetical protein
VSDLVCAREREAEREREGERGYVTNVYTTTTLYNGHFSGVVDLFCFSLWSFVSYCV